MIVTMSRLERIVIQRGDAIEVDGRIICNCIQHWAVGEEGGGRSPLVERVGGGPPPSSVARQVPPLSSTMAAHTPTVDPTLGLQHGGRVEQDGSL
jgi:hypothetical protein